MEILEVELTVGSGAFCATKLSFQDFDLFFPVLRNILLIRMFEIAPLFGLRVVLDLDLAQLQGQVTLFLVQTLDLLVLNSVHGCQFPSEEYLFLIQKFGSTFEHRNLGSVVRDLVVQLELLAFEVQILACLVKGLLLKVQVFGLGAVSLLGLPCQLVGHLDHFGVIGLLL